MKKTIAILSIFILVSCGARKVEKSKEKEVKKEINSEVSSVKSEEKTDTKSINIIDNEKTKQTNVNVFSSEVIFVPTNPEHESSITDSNGKKTTFNNLTLTTKKTSDNSIVVDSEKSKLINTLESSNIKLKDSLSVLNSLLIYNKETSTKNVDKKFNWIWLIVIVMIVIALYYIFKDDIWWI